MNKEHSSRQSFRQQLKTVKGKFARLPDNPGKWIEDGLDHINIYQYAQTELGKILNLDYSRRFKNPMLGAFQSLNSLWFYLRSAKRDERTRNIFGKVLKEHVRKNGGTNVYVPHFQAIIIHAAYLRIKGDKQMMRVLAGTPELPFDSYQVHRESGIRTRFGHTEWYTEGMEEVRAAILQGRDPDLQKFMTRRDVENGVDLYEGAISLLKVTHSEEEIQAAKDALEEMKKDVLRPMNPPKKQAREIQSIDEVPVDHATPTAEEIAALEETVLEAEAEVTEGCSAGMPVVEADPVTEEIKELLSSTEVVEVAGEEVNEAAPVAEEVLVPEVAPAVA